MEKNRNKLYELTIKSRKLNKEITFCKPLGSQICDFGSLRGSTISCYGDEKEFKSICKRWWKSYLRKEA